jgi:hypothetical protein
MAMGAYLVGSLAGRVATVLCVVVIALPYILRRQAGSNSLRPAPYLRRLWPHFWMGYLIAVLTVVHVGMVMGAMGRANVAGIWAATAGFFLMVVEIAIGLSLREAGTERRRLRTLHFWTMTAFAASLGIHLVLNG